MAALAISALLPANAIRTGGIFFDGQNLGALADAALCELRGNRIGMVFQEPATALNPLRTIRDQVAETVLAHRDVSRKEAQAQASAMLERVGLAASRLPHDRFPHQLSGGQRQRVAIALAMVLTPRLLLADEPTTALDVTTQAQVLALLRELARERHQALLLISHDLAVVAGLADRIAILQRGEVVEQGATRSLLRTPRHHYTQALVRHSLPIAIVPRPSPAPGVATPEPLVELRDVVHGYAARGTGRRTLPQRVLDGVSLALAPGERVGLVGESGSGKSTLVRILLGLESPRAGTVTVAGQVLGALRAPQSRQLRRLMQVVFQDPYGSLNPRHRVAEIVAEPLYLLEERLTPASRAARVSSALTEVGLQAAHASRFPHEFSGGERQRIAIARALIIEPRIVIFDEAVSALDTASRAQILALLARLSQERNLGYLFVSHDLTLVRAITDRVMVLREGRIVESGATAEVLSAPQHPYTRELLAATPDLARALSEGGT
jgi:peptide/nickel transport system ATP-binding protein